MFWSAPQGTWKKRAYPACQTSPSVLKPPEQAALARTFPEYSCSGIRQHVLFRKIEVCREPRGHLIAKGLKPKVTENYLPAGAK
jgi:hypothetical protein